MMYLSFYQGGIKAVIWTDAIQAGFMVAGLAAVAIKVCVSINIHVSS